MKGASDLKKIKILFVLIVLTCLQLSCSTPKNNYDVKLIFPYLGDGKIISLKEIYPYEWDYVEIISSPLVVPDFDINALLKFDPHFSLFSEVEQIIIFYNNKNIVGYTSFYPYRSDMPNFIMDTKSLSIGWKQTYQREDARFLCNTTNDLNNCIHYTQSN